jgi:hypothetical protein
VLHAQLVVELALKGALFNAQQSVTVVVADSDLNPAGHSVHTSAPLAFENVSGAQAQHAVAATASWYWPGAQLVHAADPDTFLYFPRAQVTHGPVRSGPVYPGLHWYTPEVTFNVEFFGIHGPPFAPEHHASQKQSVMLVLPAEELEFNGHLVQFAAPFESLYVPARQALH